jgi:hypothetical protein
LRGVASTSGIAPVDADVDIPRLKSLLSTFGDGGTDRLPPPVLGRLSTRDRCEGLLPRKVILLLEVPLALFDDRVEVSRRIAPPAEDGLGRREAELVGEREETALLMDDDDAGREDRERETVGRGEPRGARARRYLSLIPREKKVVPLPPFLAD